MIGASPAPVELFLERNSQVATGAALGDAEKPDPVRSLGHRHECLDPVGAQPLAALQELELDHDGARLVREQWSDPVTGAYDFRHIALKPYFVVAFDHTHNFRAVIADRVMPEAMTT